MPNLAAYREAWSAGGHPGNGKVFLRVPVYVAATEERARSEPEESVMHFYRYLGERIEESATLEGARAIENRAERGQRLQNINYDEVLRSKIIVGTPPQVVDRLSELREELGLSGILAEMNCGNRIPHQQVLTSLQLLCEEVIPKFKKKGSHGVRRFARRATPLRNGAQSHVLSGAPCQSRSDPCATLCQWT